MKKLYVKPLSIHWVKTLEERQHQLLNKQQVLQLHLINHIKMKKLPSV